MMIKLDESKILQGDHAPCPSLLRYGCWRAISAVANFLVCANDVVRRRQCTIFMSYQVLLSTSEIKRKILQLRQTPLIYSTDVSMFYAVYCAIYYYQRRFIKYSNQLHSLGGSWCQWWPFAAEHWPLNRKSLGFDTVSRTTIMSSFKIPIRGFRFYRVTHPHTYPHIYIHGDKVIAISALP